VELLLRLMILQIKFYDSPVFFVKQYFGNMDRICKNI